MSTDENTASVTFTAPIATFRFLETAYPDASTPSEALKQCVAEVRVNRLVHGDSEVAFPDRESSRGRFVPDLE